MEHDETQQQLLEEFAAAVSGWQQTAAVEVDGDEVVSARYAEQGRALEHRLVQAGVLDAPRFPWIVRLRVMTYNLGDYTAADAGARDAQRALIRELDPDVLCVQELKHHTDDPADPAPHALLAEFAEDLGLTGRLAYSRSGHHLGVLWKPEYELLDFTDYRHWPWHHGAGMATLDVGARRALHVISTHFSPFSPDQRAHEAQLLGALAPNEDNWTLIGADFNTPSTRAPEPYVAQDPGPHQLHQRIVSEIEPYNPDVAPVDRRAALLLDRFGLRDVAEWHNALDRPTPWHATTGHHPDDPHGPRMPDGLRVSPGLSSRRHSATACVHDTATARAASDHLPLVSSLRMPWQPPRTHTASTTSTQSAPH